MACEVVAEALPGAERSFIPSGGPLSSIEATLLGEPDAGLPASLRGWMIGQSPGRARSLADAGTERWGSAAWATTGAAATPLGRIEGGLLALATGSKDEASSLPTQLSRASRRSSEGRVILASRAVSARVDAEGRVRRLDGDRPAELASLLDAAGGADPRPARVVLGELVDRWRFGSYAMREGLVGVDRLRGDRGFRLLSTDAAGQPVLSRLGELIGEAAGA